MNAAHDRLTRNALGRFRHVNEQKARASDSAIRGSHGHMRRALIRLGDKVTARSNMVLAQDHHKAMRHATLAMFRWWLMRTKQSVQRRDTAQLVQQVHSNQLADSWWMVFFVRLTFYSWFRWVQHRHTLSRLALLVTRNLKQRCHRRTLAHWRHFAIGEGRVDHCHCIIVKRAERLLRLRSWAVWRASMAPALHHCASLKRTAVACWKKYMTASFSRARIRKAAANHWHRVGVRRRLLEAVSALCVNVEQKHQIQMHRQAAGVYHDHKVMARAPA